MKKGVGSRGGKVFRKTSARKRKRSREKNKNNDHRQVGSRREKLLSNNFGRRGAKGENPATRFDHPGLPKARSVGSKGSGTQSHRQQGGLRVGDVTGPMKIVTAGQSAGSGKLK